MGRTGNTSKPDGVPTSERLTASGFSNIPAARATTGNKEQHPRKLEAPLPLHSAGGGRTFASMFGRVTRDADEQLESMYKEAAKAEEDDLIDKV